jgi:hypothetical protein
MSRTFVESPPVAWSLDARIPVIAIAEDALATALAEGPAAALLLEAPLPPALPEGAAAVAGYDSAGQRHVAGCACCAGRPSAAPAFDRLFLARVRGECAWFERVLAVARTPVARAALDEALTADGVTASRFRAG